MGKVLAAPISTRRGRTRWPGVRPAVARALAEAALLQVRAYYEAGLDYGRNTMARDGLFYVGAAQAQRDFVALAGTLLPPSPKPLPPLRSLAPELDRFEDALLAAYVPPASIDRHSDFIAASASLKEARELDAAGLRYGALYKYLQAAQRLPVARDGRRTRPIASRHSTRRLDASPVDCLDRPALSRDRTRGPRRPRRENRRTRLRRSPTTCSPATSRPSNRPRRRIRRRGLRPR